MSRAAMFNPQPQVSQLLIAPGRPCVVLDDVLLQPQALVALAVQHREAFVPATANAYPGRELPLPEAATAAVAACFDRHARTALGGRRTRQAVARLALMDTPPQRLSPLQRVCHRDRLAAAPDECVLAAVLYLFDDPALGGTAFYRPRPEVGDIDAHMARWAGCSSAEMDAELGAPPGYLLDSNRFFERLAVVPARFNRLVVYDGAQFHSSHTPQPGRLCADPARGRLTLNAFFTCRRAAS